VGQSVKNKIKSNEKELQRRVDEKVKQNNEAMKQRGKEYKERLQEMEGKMRNRLLLMNQTNPHAAKLAKMENLLKLKQTARESGAKDLDSLFTPAERDLIREAELLQRQKELKQMLKK